MSRCPPSPRGARPSPGRSPTESTSPSSLVNVARGEHIDQRALHEHLEAHPDFQAGLEARWVEPFRDGEFRVDYPLPELPSVPGAPHNSGVVHGALERGVSRAAERLRQYIEEGRIEDVVEPPAGP